MPDYPALIRQSGLTIYEPISTNSPLYIPTLDLEHILNCGMRGTKVAGLALRTRSKVVKSRVCEVLGYPVPKSFKKVQPRFPGQNLDIYTQSSDNLQIWNEEISPIRRYAVIREADGDLAFTRVITGEALALLDTTGTLTQKYQARLTPGHGSSELIVQEDTAPIHAMSGDVTPSGKPTDYPRPGNILSIQEVFKRLTSLVGVSFPDAGRDQERNRGSALHRLVCTALGYTHYADDGTFPDVKSEVLEVKLQTSPTIDLGLVTPDSTDILDIPPMNGVQLRHCDCRYAIFSATTDGTTVTLTHLYLTTGEAFFTRFPRFEGNVINRKIQIPLPKNFFKA